MVILLKLCIPHHFEVTDATARSSQFAAASMKRMACGSSWIYSHVGLLVLVLVVACVGAVDNVGTFAFDAQSYTIKEDAGTSQVKIVRTGGATGGVVVKYALTKPLEATATVNKNFKLTDAGYAVNFAESQLVGSINIDVINDADYEANEFFFLQITSVSPTGAIGTIDTVVVFIEDDGDAGVFNFAVPYIFCREDSGNAVVSIERSLGFSSASYVPVALVVTTVTAESNATNGGSKAFDYLGVSQELTWATDEVSKTFAVKVFNNDKYEPISRAIKVRLESVKGGAAIGAKSDMWVYIIDDRDAGTLSFALSHYEVLENGGRVVVNVTRSGIPDATNVNTYTDGAVTVDIATYSGTILPGKSRYELDYDYDIVKTRGCTHVSPCTAVESIAYIPMQTTQLAFADKEAWKTIDILIVNNDLFQAPDPVFKVVLHNVGGGAHLGIDFEHPLEWNWYHDEFLALETHADQLIDNVGTIVTIKDDGDPAVLVSKASLSVSEIGQIDTFRVRLNSIPISDVTIQFGADVAELKLSVSTLTFSSTNWNQYQTVTVGAVPDDTADGIHSSLISLTASSNDVHYKSPLKLLAGSPGCTFAVSIYTQKWGTYETGNAKHAFPWKDSDGVLTSPSQKSSIEVFILDDDHPILRLTPEVIRHQEIGRAPQNFVSVRVNGHSAAVGVALPTKPHADVDISFIPDSYSYLQVTPASIRITPLTWQVVQYITVSVDARVDTSNEVQYSKILAYSFSSGDAMYNRDMQPVGSLFVQRFPAVSVLLNSSRVTTRENGGDEAIVTYNMNLGSEPMHWEPEGSTYRRFEITLQSIADTTLIFSPDAQESLGASTSLITAGNSSQSTSGKTVRKVAVVRFETYPLIQTRTGSSQVGLAILRLFRLSGGENGGLGGIVVGVSAAAMESSDTWNETLLRAKCTQTNLKFVPECSLVESDAKVSLFSGTTTFKDLSSQSDGETVVKQSTTIDRNTNKMVPSSGWVEIDVTAALNRVLAKQRDQMLGSSAKTISFLVYSRSAATFVYDGVDEVTFASKENSDATLRPQLQIVASGSVNLALSGTASQSQQGSASAAMDGKTNANSNIASSYAMSRTVDAYPWWQIDLKDNRRIEDIVVTIKGKVPAADLRVDQLTTTFWVFLSDVSFSQSNDKAKDFVSAKSKALNLRDFTVSRSFDASEDDIITYRWRVNGEKNGFFGEDRFVADYSTPAEARYVRLQIEGENSIILNEVEIYQQAFASSRISIGGYIPSVASARTDQNQIEFLLPSMQGADPSPCDKKTRICRHELLFTSGNWRELQPIQVHAIDDKVATGDREVMITHTADSLDDDYAGGLLCSGTQTACNPTLFNDSSVKKLLILEDDENKVILSKSEIIVTEGSNAYPGATPFYKLSDLQTRFLRCSDDPNAVVDLHSSSHVACTASFRTDSATPWETCITNTSALPLESGSAWYMAGFESATNLSTVSFEIPALTGAKYIRQLTLWGNPNFSITRASIDVLKIKNWIQMGTLQVSMKSGGAQVITMSDLSLVKVYSILIVFDKSYDVSTRCILAPQVKITGYAPVPFPLPIRGDLSSSDSVPPEVSHLSRMHLYGVPDTVAVRLSSEPLADTLVSVFMESASEFVTAFDATNKSSDSSSLSTLVGAKYESGEVRQFRVPPTLRFTAQNWEIVQELTFLAVDDNTYLGDRKFPMHISSSSPDSVGLNVPTQSIGSSAISRDFAHLPTSLSYSRAFFVVRDHEDSSWPYHIATKWQSATGTIQVTVVDDDLPGVTLSANEVVVSESTSKTNFSVSLDSAPLQDVTIKILYEKDPSLFSASPLELTFTRLNWHQPQWIDIYPVANDIYDGASPFTLSYDRLISKANQPLLRHQVTSLDGKYDGLQVGTNEKNGVSSYTKNQGVRIIIQDDDTGCANEYECLNGGACIKTMAGNTCSCPSTLGMKNCSAVCERANECAFDRLLFNIRCFEGKENAVCSTAFSAEALTSVLYRMLTSKAFTALDGHLYPKLALGPMSDVMYVVNNSKTSCVDGLGGCVFVSIDFMRPNLDDTSVKSKLFAYQEAGSLKSTPMHIEMMTTDPQYVESSSAKVGMWIFVGFCGAALAGTGSLFAARAVRATTSHVLPDNDGEQAELLAVGATSPREVAAFPSSSGAFLN